jgi:hypothetical protein
MTIPPKKSNDFIIVEIGGGAQLCMQHPCSDFHWRMLHEPHPDQLVLAGSILDSMNSLLFDSISHTEACRRLKIMRRAWAAAAYPPNSVLGSAQPPSPGLGGTQPPGADGARPT